MLLYYPQAFQGYLVNPLIVLISWINWLARNNTGSNLLEEAFMFSVVRANLSKSQPLSFTILRIICPE